MILALDLSTSTGWATLKDGLPMEWGRIQIEPKQIPLRYPYNYVTCAREIGKSVLAVYTKYQPHQVVIEETNRAGRFTSRYSQKLLEFIHYAVVTELPINKINYMDTSQWRKVSQATLSQEQIRKNKEFTDAKDLAFFELKVRYAASLKQTQTTEHVGPKAKDMSKKKIDKEADKLARQDMRSVKGHHLGKDAKVTFKHVSVSRVNELFGLTFELKDNDITDAILVGYGYHKLKKGR